ncbi:MAG: aldehyde dehydrogenase family protein [Rhodococcus qingshengii]
MERTALSRLLRSANWENRAVDEGGRLLVGGSRVEGTGSFLEPTLLTDVPLSARIAHEEDFRAGGCRLPGGFR